MSILHAENFKGQYIDRPSQKTKKGETAGRRRSLVDRITVPADIALDDEILVGVLPANCTVLDAKIFINKSLGADGIFEMGHRASTLEESGDTLAENSNGFVSAADAGGQAVLKRADQTNTAIGVRLGSETEVFVKCTEKPDESVDDAVLFIDIEYVSD